MLKRATSEQSYSRLVDDLKNDSQEKIVASKVEQNMLIGRFSHILVDEYQDIDGEQYELVWQETAPLSRAWP